MQETGKKILDKDKVAATLKMVLNFLVNLRKMIFEREHIHNIMEIYTMVVSNKVNAMDMYTYFSYLILQGILRE